MKSIGFLILVAVALMKPTSATSQSLQVDPARYSACLQRSSCARHPSRCMAYCARYAGTPMSGGHGTGYQSGLVNNNPYSDQNTYDYRGPNQPSGQVYPMGGAVINLSEPRFDYAPTEEASYWSNGSDSSQSSGSWSNGTDASQGSSGSWSDQSSATSLSNSANSNGVNVSNPYSYETGQ